MILKFYDYLKSLNHRDLNDKEVALLEKVSFELESLLDAYHHEKLLREDLELAVIERYGEQEIKDKSNDELARLAGYRDEKDFIKKHINKYIYLMERK